MYNPQTPDYAPGENIKKGIGLASYDNHIDTHFIYVLGSRAFELKGDEQEVFIDKVDKGAYDEYTVRYEAIIELTNSLNSITPSAIQLDGSTLADVTLVWTFNKAITSQKLFINSVETAFTPVPGGNNQYSVLLAGQNITADTEYRIEGYDGISYANAIGTVKFGNYWYRGKVNAQWSSIPGNFLSERIPDLTTDKSIVKDNTSLTFTCKGGVGEWDWVAIPLSIVNLIPQFKDRANFGPGGFNQIGTIVIPNGQPGEPNDLYTVFQSINNYLTGAIYDIE